MANNNNSHSFPHRSLRGPKGLLFGVIIGREALESAISEKDAHLALLEISGIRSARQAEEVDRLRMDKRRLVEKLKKRKRFIPILSISAYTPSDKIVTTQLFIHGAELSISLIEEMDAEDELSMTIIHDEVKDQRTQEKNVS
ncbi:hypothetical protein NQ318_007256 [Aromia moschata]|uniref:Uncharacterized protein n=1 Tax=Aromia moschata TaxID=1265417 RepID=A0AAV8XTI2_9CUCU|nr:hypothetical protein NQ318_007256 [Aromia moschata]